MYEKNITINLYLMMNNIENHPPLALLGETPRPQWLFNSLTWYIDNY
jgi:hypothetical protein